MPGWGRWLGSWSPNSTYLYFWYLFVVCCMLYVNIKIQRHSRAICCPGGRVCRVEAGGWGVVGGGRTVQPARSIPEHLSEIFQLTIPEDLSGHRAIISNVKNLPKTTRTNHLVVNFVWSVESNTAASDVNPGGRPKNILTNNAGEHLRNIPTSNPEGLLRAYVSKHPQNQQHLHQELFS